jgi:tetratricopeptide (TPR) repeat protein
MKFRFLPFFVVIAYCVTFLAASNLTAQIKNNLAPTGVAQGEKTGSSNVTSTTKSVPKQTEITESADPKIVKTYSDAQLNDLMDRMVSSNNKDAVLFNNVGAAYFEFKMYDKAENAIRRAVVINNHPAFLTNLSIIYDVQGRTSEAITVVQRAIAQSPRYARARTQLCGLMMTSKHDADAILCYEELSKIAPLDLLDQTYYAAALVHSKNFDKAINILTPLAKSPQPTSAIFNTLGFAYYMKKRYTQAADAFKQAVEIEPENPMLRYNLALSLTAVNNRVGALSQYSLLKEKDPALADQLYKYLYRDKIIFVDEQTSSKNPKK